MHPPYSYFETCTHLRVRKLSRLASRLYDAELAVLGIKATQFSLMQHLDRLEPVCASALAGAMAMDASTMTRGLRLLFDRKWVTRGAGVDSRQRILCLTVKGREAFIEARERWNVAQCRIREMLGQEDLLALHEILDRACERLRSVS